MDRNRLSFNTGNMSGNLTDKLAALHAAGFAAATFWPADFFERFEFVGSNFDAAAGSGVRPTCYMMMRMFEGIPAAAKVRKLELARQMMDQMALIGATTLVQTSNVSPDVDQDWSRAVSDFQELGELARTHGIRVAFEPLSQGPWINTYQLGWQLVQDVDHPNFGLVLDASHVFLAESSLDQIDKIDGAKIFLCEVSDFAQSNLPHREMLRNYRLFPGEGVRPIRSFVERVMATGYHGDFSTEVFNAFYRTLDPVAVAKRGYAALEKLFGKELGA